MKAFCFWRSILPFILFFSFSSFQAQEVVVGPSISFDKETHDYGLIEYGGDGTCEFVVTNNGTEPLLITNARASCGCTVPDYPKEPIAPGESAVIKVEYTKTSNPGTFRKTVTVTSNDENNQTVTLVIKGEVAPKPEGAAPAAPATGPAAVPNGNGAVQISVPK